MIVNDMRSIKNAEILTWSVQAKGNLPKMAVMPNIISTK
jgi:hypothetical protein